MIKTDLDFILMCIVFIALGVGLISMLVGRAVDWYDRLGAWWDAHCQTFREERGIIMSSADDDADDVYAADTDTDGDDDKLVLADTDAVPGGSRAGTGSGVMPAAGEPAPSGISRRMKDVELLTLLAVQRGEKGGWKFSGNKIYALIGGNRDAVMAQIKAIRNVPPEATYPPRNDEQRQFRADMIEV